MQNESKTVNRQELMNVMLRAEDQSIIPLMVTGSSMVPFLLDRRSVVYLKKDSAYVPHRGDIVMFMRVDGSWVLHRVLKVLPDGRLVINGDGQRWTEIIYPYQIMAHVTCFVRKKREVSVENKTYRILSRVWMRLRPIHGAFARLFYYWHRLSYKLFPAYMKKRDEKKDNR